MRKYLFVALFIVITLTPVYVLASGGLGAGDLSAAVSKSYAGKTNLGTSIGNIVSAILALAGTIFLVLTVYGGITWMTAMGNGEKVEKAKNIIIAAVIGGAITASAYAITFFVMGKIGNQGNNEGKTGQLCCCPSSGSRTSCELVTYDLNKENSDYASCEAIDSSMTSADLSACSK